MTSQVPDSVQARARIERENACTRIFVITEVVRYEARATDEDQALALHLDNRSSFVGVDERGIEVKGE